MPVGVRFSCVFGCGRQARRNIRTARTRRDSLPLKGSASFPKIVETCFSTAPSEITSLSAIPWFERPAAISSGTSRSRAVSLATGSSALAEASLDQPGRASQPRDVSRRYLSAHSLDAILSDFNKGNNQEEARELTAA